jgi:tol-pal system protein YbgF
VRSEGQKPLAALAACACALVFLSVPVYAALFDDDLARKQIAEERRRVEELRQQQSQLAERLGKVEEALKSQPVLALVSQIEALREEMRQLRGQIEVVANNIDTAGKRQRDMYVDLDTRLRRIEQGASGGAPAPGASVTPAPGGTAPPTQVGSVAAGEDARAYEAAQNQRRIGNYQAAVVAFQGFLAQYPQSPLAPRAQYWIGDSYFNLRDFKNAIASQQKLMAAYPDSASVPDAMLNVASCQLELGDPASARRTMDTLVARYPASEAAEKARRRLATLR